MDERIMWEASEDRKGESLCLCFIRRIVGKYGVLPSNGSNEYSEGVSQVLFEQLHVWSIRNLPLFWYELWDFVGIIGHKNTYIDTHTHIHTLQKLQYHNTQLVQTHTNPIYTKFLPNATFSYAQNLLRKYPSNEVAIISWAENLYKETVTHTQLYERVSVLAQALKETGFQVGDRAVGIFPVVINSLVAMLAVNSIGGIWSSCSPDFGVDGLLDRFGQITPKVIFTTDFYIYKNKQFQCIDKAIDLMNKIPTVHTLIVCPYCNTPPLPVKKPAIPLHQFIRGYTPKTINFVELNFNDPTFILYSSGTTGLPKCFLHRNGALLQLLKEHQIHLDLKPGYRMFHFTTCGWMMWNWTVAGLASNINLAFYDGSPFYPTYQNLWKFVEQTKLNYVGISPKYLITIRSNGVKELEKKFDLSNLKVCGSAGSPLTAQLCEYIYHAIKKDMHVCSFTGGTDLLGCFLHGNPLGPVRKGEMQGLALGMDVKILDDNGKETNMGELVCVQPFISQPIKFFNDPTGEKYRLAYYDKFPNYWAHGDLTEKTNTKGYIIHGRSDTVLNPGGVRIGTAEIYRVMETMPEIEDSAAVGCNMNDDVYVFLFVVLKQPYKFTNDLVSRIKKQIKDKLTTRHVPSFVYCVEELPLTKTGKVSELAIRDVLHNRPVKNKGSLENPQALLLFKQYAVHTPQHKL